MTGETRSVNTAAIWSYPWDLLAEGVDHALAHIADTGLNAVSLAVSYHSGMVFLPHNPRERIRFLEDGSIYFQPHSGHFSGLAIQPRVSRLADDVDPLYLICEAAEKRGLQVVAWSVCTHNSYQGERHLDKVVRNAFGDPYLYALCPSHPDVQAYLQALMRELSGYPLQALQLESYEFMGFPHGYHHEKINMDLGPYGRYLMGLCFCPACRAVSATEGVDFDGIRSATHRYLADLFEGRVSSPQTLSEEGLFSELPQLQPYIAMRDRVVIEAVRNLSEAASVPLNLLGIKGNMVETLTPHIAEVTAMAYHVAAEDVAQTTVAARDLVGPSLTLGIGIETCPHLTPNKENMVAKVRAARDSGAENLYFYNYGLMPLTSLGWLRAALNQVDA